MHSLEVRSELLLERSASLLVKPKPLQELVAQRLDSVLLEDGIEAGTEQEGNC
jgi:hypothetical protein